MCVLRGSPERFGLKNTQHTRHTCAAASRSAKLRSRTVEDCPPAPPGPAAAAAPPIDSPAPRMKTYGVADATSLRARRRAIVRSVYRVCRVGHALVANPVRF